MGTGDGRFVVDLPDLERLAKELDSAKAELDSALKAMGGADPAGLGMTELDSACAHFQSRWGYGLGELGKDAQALHDGLAKVLKNYGRTEADLAAGLQGKG
ncbi:hypothetical protein OG455_39435 [Kitasatospora sp. NBC_01287]|uniref:hypothetical protein n=1 Tax=Kitasatospora sp. NBC_01287 TaxID=2903573 RepID=UPI0022512D8D|nr:hypothetical protein [Kitasatospora sp. NBC_01287]MCX4751510.1 hypothetical protein [Kitasatospora sp. NBC_01287]